MKDPTPVDAPRSPPSQLRIAPLPDKDWDAYVIAHPGASVYHHAAWPLLINEVFGQEAYFLHARDDQERLIGVLPVIRQRGPLLGSFMTSLPYFNYGGVLADSDHAALRLMEAARDMARNRGCQYLELRGTSARPGGWVERVDKASMVLSLPADAELLGKQLGAKLRSQIRRPEREGATVAIGGAAQVAPFYDVFSRNMHALGTPVYPRRFFDALVDRFPSNCRLVVVSARGTPMAAGFLVMHGGMAEIPWAACRADAKPRGYNMKLYWECLLVALAESCQSFDFGRSTIDSGTYRFKAQWGAKPKQLHWHRWERNTATDASKTAPGDMGLRRIVSGVWRKLPLPVANVLGPLVSPRLPW